MFGMVNENPDRKPICTDDYVLVTIDTAFALAWIPLVLFTKPSDSFGAHEAAITGGLILGGLSATSAGFGIHDVVTCRRATRSWQAAHPGQEY
jgi:hypothetical protein